MFSSKCLKTYFMFHFISNFPGHLMGKKSIEEQEVKPDSDYLTPSKIARVTEHLMEALMQPKNHKQVIPQSADRLLRRYWREEDREKYLTEVGQWN